MFSERSLSYRRNDRHAAPDKSVGSSPRLNLSTAERVAAQPRRPAPRRAAHAVRADLASLIRSPQPAALLAEQPSLIRRSRLRSQKYPGTIFRPFKLFHRIIQKQTFDNLFLSIPRFYQYCHPAHSHLRTFQAVLARGSSYSELARVGDTSVYCPLVARPIQSYAHNVFQVESTKRKDRTAACDVCIIRGPLVPVQATTTTPHLPSQFYLTENPFYSFYEIPALARISLVFEKYNRYANRT